jgi:hypothetical protein
LRRRLDRGAPGAEASPAPERELAARLQLPADVEAMTPEEVLGFVLERFPGRVSLACSFQKE